MTDFSTLVDGTIEFRRARFPGDYTSADDPQYGLITYFFDWLWDGQYGILVDWVPDRTKPYWKKHPYINADAQYGLTAILEEFSDEWKEENKFE